MPSFCIFTNLTKKQNTVPLLRVPLSLSVTFLFPQQVTKKLVRGTKKTADKPDPIVFLPVAVSTSGRVYDDFVRLLFLHVHREASILAGESPEASDQFRFLRAARLANPMGSAGLILGKVSVMRVTIPIDLSTLSFIPLPHFFDSRRGYPLLTPSLVLFPLRYNRHMLSLLLQALSSSLCIIVLT